MGLNTAEEEDPAAKARAFRDQHRLTFPILVDADGKVAAAFGVEGLPTNVLIDKEGKVRYLEAGFDQRGIDTMLKQLLPGGPAAAPRGARAAPARRAPGRR